MKKIDRPSANHIKQQKSHPAATPQPTAQSGAQLLNPSIVPRIRIATAPLSSEDVLSLQRTIGNRATRELLQSRASREVIQRDLDQGLNKVRLLETLPVPSSNKSSENSIIKNTEWADTWKFLLEDLENYAKLVQQEKESPEEAKLLQWILQGALDIKKAMTPHSDSDDLMRRVYAVRLKPIDDIVNETRSKLADLGVVTTSDSAEHNEYSEEEDDQQGESDSEQQLADPFENAIDVSTETSPFAHGAMGGVFPLKDNADQLFKPLQPYTEERGAAMQRAKIKGINGPMRAVATHQLDQLLGTGVTGEAKLAVNQAGEKGHVMAKASGQQLGKFNPEEKAKLYEKPTVKRGLYNLQTLDYLTGELDRHYENIMADPASGVITGIDNETAFSGDPRRTTQKIHKAFKHQRNKQLPLVKTAKAAGIPAVQNMLTVNETHFVDRPKLFSLQHPKLRGIWNTGLPKYMDENVARTIVGLNKGQIVDAVNNLIDDDAIEVLLVNFVDLQVHAATLLEKHDKNPADSNIIPEGDWDRVTPKLGKDNYFYK